MSFKPFIGSNILKETFAHDQLVFFNNYHYLI